MELNLEPRNNKGQKHGLWTMYGDNGSGHNMWYKGKFFNGKSIGLHIFNGIGYKNPVIEKTYYII